MNIVSIKTSCAAICMVIILLPQFAQAQVTSDRALLLQTIQTLLKQVEILQALVDDRQPTQYIAKQTEVDSDLLDDFAGDIVRFYQLEQDGSLPADANAADRQYFEQLRQVMPNQYVDYFDQFLVFSNHPADASAFVEVQSDGRTTDWLYGVSVEEVVEDPTSDLSRELMIHEFAHVFTLDEVINGQSQTTNCHDYFASSGCYPNGSYLDEFIDEFWDDELLDELETVNSGRNPEPETGRLYNRYDSEFVTSYAASDPAEDFAESFTWYVLGLPVERRSVAAEKIDFMDSFRQIRSYKTEILRDT